ncbi:MAG: DNA methyltransferase, partial [Oligoflexia bacterium]|nr:DNA methyltransferase [Oligoflexia bacterium]
IPFLVELLKDTDPEIVLQAIRALIIFKDRKVILTKLKKMKTHPNEIIQDIIKKEFFQEKRNQEKETHTQFPEKLKNRVVLGDIEDIIKKIPNESIHLTFTSPPYYNARDYSIYKSYKGYLRFLTRVFKEVFRVTKEGRFFVLNTSPIIIPRAGRKYSSKRYPIPYDIHHFLMEMGWEFIDDIIWLKPEASVKNRNAGFGQHRKPLAYKPNTKTEMVMVYRKKTDKLIDWNIKQYPTALIEESKIKDQYETSNVWAIDPSFDKIHNATFPLELCNRIIKLYSVKNDLVFDPFAGSGTLGKSAVNLGRNFFLTEKKAEYFERIQENIGLLTGHYSGLKEFEEMS